MSHPELLLDWMLTRGPGDITARAIGECGPRGLRRKAESDAALAALLAAGSIVEVSARPRTFRSGSSLPRRSGRGIPSFDGTA